MGITTAMNVSLSGLRANQSQLETTSNNIANAGSPGYSRKRVNTIAEVGGSSLMGVSATKVQRQLDLQLQRQWRVSVANAEYAAVRQTTLERVDQAFGGPDNPNALDNTFSQFKSLLEALATSPDNSVARSQAVAGAEALAQRLGSLSNDIQTLRQEAEGNIAAAVKEANDLLKRIDQLDAQIVQVTAGSQSTAGLEDERDQAIDRLSELMDIRVEDQAYGAVAIYTTSGVLLYDDDPVEMQFDEQGMITPTSVYSTDPNLRGVGTLRIISGPGKGMDLFSDGSLRSGAIAAYREMRDVTLVQAQSQLDELAAQLSQALSTRSEAGTAVTVPAAGFAVDLNGLQEGDLVTLNVTTGSGAQTIRLVNSAGTFTAGNTYTADPNDTVVPIDFSQSDANVATAIQAALGANYTVAYAGGNLTVTDASGGAITIDGLSAGITVTGTQDDVALPLFIDAATKAPYTGLVNGETKKTGLAARLMVNPAVKADPTLMVAYSSTTASADTTRPRAIIDALTTGSRQFSPQAGIGSRLSPFSGSIEQYIRQVISFQGSEAEQARNISEGQSIVTANLEERYEASREVDIDEEMTFLIQLQTAYQANARVMTAAREMLETLINAF